MVLVVLSFLNVSDRKRQNKKWELVGEDTTTDSTNAWLTTVWQCGGGYGALCTHRPNIMFCVNVCTCETSLWWGGSARHTHEHRIISDDGQVVLRWWNHIGHRRPMRQPVWWTHTSSHLIMFWILCTQTSSGHGWCAVQRTLWTILLSYHEPNWSHFQPHLYSYILFKDLHCDSRSYVRVVQPHLAT